MTQRSEYDVVIIGAGPAGTSAAITAARSKSSVLLLERGRFPRHKVCGEFVSPEAHALLQSLLGTDGDRLIAGAPKIPQGRLFFDSHSLTIPLDPPAFSISRFDLDQALWQASQSAGCECLEETVVANVEKHDSEFAISVGSTMIRAKTVINASGRWSSFNARSDPKESSKLLGIKAHFRESGPPASTDLYFFEGGYCGVQPVADGVINASALVKPSFRSLAQVFQAHPALKSRSEGWIQQTDTVTTFPVLFRRPQPVSESMLNVGDAAAFIDPFAGDGISLALRSGALAATLRSPEAYARVYATQFAGAFRTAAWIRRSFAVHPLLRRFLLEMAARTALPRYLLARTRGR